MEQWRDGFLKDLVDKVRKVDHAINGPLGLQRRMNIIEYGSEGSNSSSRVPSPSADVTKFNYFSFTQEKKLT